MKAHGYWPSFSQYICGICLIFPAMSSLGDLGSFLLSGSFIFPSSFGIFVGSFLGSFGIFGILTANDSFKRCLKGFRCSFKVSKAAGVVSAPSP